MNNLRLDIFGGGLGDGSKMKRLFPNRKSKTSPTIEHPSEMTQSGHTLDRIVNAKEEVRRLKCQYSIKKVCVYEMGHSEGMILSTK